MATIRKPAKAPRGSICPLPGFGPKTTVALANVGIKTLAELRACDPYDLYRELKCREPRVSLNFLYAILAAHEGTEWREVQRTRRTEVLLKLDEMGLAPKRAPARQVRANA